MPAYHLSSAPLPLFAVWLALLGLAVAVGGAALQYWRGRHMLGRLHQWQHIFENADWGLVVGDADGGALGLMNPAFARMHGWTVEELTGRPILTVFAPSEHARLPELVRLTNESGKRSYESLHIRKDGTVFPVWIDATAIKDRQGRVLYRAVNVIDISVRKRMEQQLRQSEQMLRKVLEALPVGVMVLDASGQPVIKNPAAERICDGLGPDALERLYQAWNARTGALLDRSTWGIVRALDHGVSTVDELVEIECADRSRRTLSSSAVPLLDDEGRVSGAVCVNQDITQARRAEQALARSEASLANAQRLAQLGNWDADLASGELYCSGEVFRIFGMLRGPGRSALRPLLRRIVPADRRRVLVVLRAALANRGRFDLQAHLRTPEGGMRVLHGQADVRFGVDGRAVGMSGVVQDITEKTQAELRLRRQEEQFRALVEHSPDAIGRFDRDGCCVYANPAMEAATGWSRERSTGMPVDLVFPAPAGALWRQAIERVFASGVAESLEMALGAPDLERYYHARLVPEFDDSPAVRKVLAVARDITVLKSGEAVLRQSEQRLHAITANLPGVVFQCELGTGAEQPRFTYVSGGAALLFGLDPARLMDDAGALLEHIAQADRDALRLSLRRSASLLCVWDWEGRLAGPGGEVWINCRATPRREAHDLVVWDGVMLNISDSKRGEQELRQSRQQLRALSAHLESVREEERRRIAREVHDELGQALTALRMDVSMLRVHVGGQHADLDTRLQAMKELVDGTIGIVRHITSTLRPAALDLGLTAAIEWLVQDFGKRTGIRCVLETHGGDVLIDDSRATALFRMVQESLVNVVKHAQASRVTVLVREELDHVCVEVADNGVGFVPGTGAPQSFGLVGMRERALMIGGTVEIRSRPGSGTVVWICVPQNEETMSKEET